MSEPKKLQASKGRIYCPKFTYTSDVWRICMKCKFFKGTTGAFGDGPYVFCAYERKNA